MGVSARGKFKVIVLCDGKEMLEYTSPEGDVYISVVNKLPFIIRVEALEIDVQYGCKLYLDGKLYKYSKVFKSHGHFFGFKMGYGVYKEFLFERPDVASEDSNTIQEEISDSNRGKIRIVFYNTQLKLGQCKLKQPTKYEKYEHFRRQENKKLCKEPSCIQEGNIKDFGTQSQWIEKVYSKCKDKENYYEYCLDETDPIDEAEIMYLDFPSLILNGILSMKNIHHLYMIPDKGFEYAFQALETVIIHCKKVKLEELSAKFEQFTKKKIESYLNGNSIETMISTFSHKFFVSEEGYVTTIKRKESLQNEFVPQNTYYLTSNEERYLQQKRKHRECINTCDFSSINVEVISDSENPEIIKEDKLKYKIRGECFSNRVMEEYEDSRNKMISYDYVDLVEDEDLQLIS